MWGCRLHAEVWEYRRIVDRSNQLGLMPIGRLNLSSTNEAAWVSDVTKRFISARAPGIYSDLRVALK